jgi:hypothetical protein
MTLWTMTRVWTIGAIVAVTSMAACDAHDHEGEETPEAEACEHLVDGPAQAVDAKADPKTSDLADVSKSHTRFDVTLPADASGTYGGYVRFLAPAKGGYLVVANASTPLQVIDSAGAEVTPTSAAATPACSAAKVQLGLNLDVATYLVKLGPAPQAKVGLLFEAK